jgi:hypothetical protein
MTKSTAPSESGDLVFARFLQDLDVTGDKLVVLEDYCLRYPRYAAEFRRVFASGGFLDRFKDDPADQTAIPDHLGDFQIRRFHARGGMGDIYEALQDRLDRRVALKIMTRDQPKLDERLRRRFLREQRVLARLHHTHIVPIHAAGCEGRWQYFAMDFIEGAALSNVIRTVHDLSSSTPSRETPSLAEVAGELANDAETNTGHSHRRGRTATSPRRRQARSQRRVTASFASQRNTSAQSRKSWPRSLTPFTTHTKPASSIAI